MSRNPQYRRPAKRWLALALAVCWLPAFLRAESTAPASATNASPSARVVIVRAPGAMETYRPDTAKIAGMVDRGIQHFTGKASVAEAWRSLVSTQDTVGIKVVSGPGPTSGTRPAVVEAVVKGLLAAGVPPGRVVIWDRSAVALRLAGFFDLARRLGVRAAGAQDSGWDENTSYDTALIGSLVYGDLEFERKGQGIGRKSFLSKLVSRELTKIISVAPMLNHTQAGVSGHLWSLAMSSVDNTLRFENSADRLAEAVPEIYTQLLADRVVLNLTDALLGQYEGGERSLLHYSSVLNELRFSRDPVALDALSVLGLQRMRDSSDLPGDLPARDLYNIAALMDLGVNDPKRMTIERLP